MEITPFAGLTALDEGDAITIDGASFVIKNPRIEDKLLRVGAVTHRHDGHVALPNPHVSLTGNVTASGGSLPTDTTLAVTYTVIDQHGGETTAAAPLVLTTGAGVNNPAIAPSAAVVTSAGIMPDGSYFYALTYTDGQGGETLLGPQTLVSIPPGFASASIVLSGLASELAPHGAGSQWRLWRSYEGADWHLVSQGSTNTFDDGGFDPPDNPARPPQVNTTQGAYSMVVTIPTAVQDPAIASGSSLNIYLAEDTTFADPSFYESVPIASAGQTFVISNLTVSQGAPPRVSLSISGANQIDPDTDILDWHWKRPVATNTVLPSGAQGDVRMTLDTGHLWGVLNPSGAVGAANWTDLFSIVPDPDSQYMTSFVASASGGAAARVSGELEFAGSGIASVVVQDLGGGSGAVRIAVPPPPLPITQGVGGAGAVPLVDPAYYVQFVGTNGATVSLTDLGGGSAQVTVDASVATGDAAVAAAASGGAGRILPVHNFEFGASGGVNVAVQDLGGGSARVVLGAPGSVPKATQASGYAFGVNDPGTVVESASGGNGSAMTAFYINPNAQTPIPVDSVIEVFQYGTGQVMIVPSGGVVLRSDGNKSKVNSQFGTIGLRQRAIDEWVLTGDLT